MNYTINKIIKGKKMNITEMIDKYVGKNLTEEKVISINGGYTIVIHTSHAYDKPQITILKPNEVKDYFSDDNGFEDADLKKVQKMKTNDHIWVGGDEGVVVVKS
jgi:hypothetical protein